MKKLQDWYDGMEKGQRTFIWIIALIFAFFGVPATIDYPIGLLMYIPLAILIYLKLGSRNHTTNNIERNDSKNRI